MKTASIDDLVNRFLAWPLPPTVACDPCVTEPREGRSGTNLLTLEEARKLIAWLFPAESENNLVHEASMPSLDTLPDDEARAAAIKAMLGSVLTAACQAVIEGRKVGLLPSFQIGAGENGDPVVQSISVVKRF